jgi:hypothetical protein
LITIEQNEPKVWSLVKNDEEKIQIKLHSSSITNKFEIVVKFINNLIESDKTFGEWFYNFINECQDENIRAVVIDKNIDKIKEFVNNYIEHTAFDYSKFVDETKAKKGSILFNVSEIKEIIKLSSYLKIYSFISNSENLNVSDTVHKFMYNRFAENIIKTDVASKIFDVVKTKTFRYNMTDKFMWDYIKAIQCKDIGIHVVEIFNFIMNNIIILCEEDKNPIIYFIGVIDESVKWFLRSVYKGSIVYDDSISTEDIHGINADNLRTYSFNDTLGKLKGIAYKKVYSELEFENSNNLPDKDNHLVNFTQRIESIEYISPLCNSILYPLLSKITGITYVHFITISPEHAAILSFYLNMLLQKVFKTEYKSLFTLLDYYPTTSPSVSTSYQIKSVQDFLNFSNKVKNFYGFDSVIQFVYKSISHFIGRVSRISFCHLLTGQKLSGIPLSKVEQDMITFFTLFFSGKIDAQIAEVSALIHIDF